METYTVTTAAGTTITGELLKVENGIAYILQANGNIYLCPKDKLTEVEA
jgi:hypothetical protein